MRDEVWTETLRCDLSEAEVSDRAENAALAFGEAEEVEAEFKATAEEQRGQIKRLRARVGELLRAVREAAEYRSVDCVERRNEGEAKVEVIRVDTGELVRSRPFTPDERQLALGILPQEDSKAATE